MKRITTASEGCAAVFAHLDASEPRIPVNPAIAVAKRYLRDDLKHSPVVTTAPAYFSEILPSIHWANPPADAERCGLDLLLFIGELSQAMHQHQRYDLPLARMAEILLRPAI